MLNHKKIRMARRIMNLTQRQISRKCGISQSYLSLLENGAVNPSVEIVSKIARLLNLKIDDIVEV